jgi:hypothetical protein
VVAEGLVDADAAAASAVVSADRADDVPVEVLLPQPGQVLAHHDVVVQKHHPAKLREELLERTSQCQHVRRRRASSVHDRRVVGWRPCHACIYPSI